MRTTSILLASCAVTASALAQTPVVLVEDGQAVPGVGNVTSIDNLAVNASGDWIVESDTDNPTTTADGVLLKNGVVLLRQSDPVPAPAGAVISSFDAVTLNANGESGWNLFLTGPPTNADTGIFFGTTLVIQEGSISTAPQFSAGTIYTGFFETKMNDARTILIVASVDDPAIPSTTDRAMVLAQVDAAGALLSETVIFKEGDMIPGILTETIVDFGTGPHDFALNNSGVTLYTADLTGTTTNDGVVMLGTAPILREGDASPIAGRNWETLYGRSLDLGDGGDYVVHANLDGATSDDDLIVKNGAVIIAREGSGPASIAPYMITSFSSAPVRVDSAGNVFWYGDWNDPDTTRDTGIFRNDELIVQKGVTMTSGGALITAVSGVESAFSISPDGRFLIFEGQTAGGVDSAFLMDLQPQFTPFCFGDGSGTACPCGNTGAAGNGCANSVVAAGGNIAASGTASLSADTVVLTGSGMPNSSALYFQGTAQQSGGLGITFGDGLRCAGGTIVRLGTKSNSAGTSQYPTLGDPTVSVRGLVMAPGTRTYQIWYRNAAAFCTASTFNLTNGVSVIWNS